jgi:hypothetical protein
VTEAKWNSSTDPQAMLAFLHVSGKASDRQFRLFALACCSRIGEHITDPRSRAAIEFAERHAEAGVARRKGRPAVAQAARAFCKKLDVKGYQLKNGTEYAAHMMTANAAHAALGCIEGSAWLAASCAAGCSANAIGWRLLAAARSVALRAWDARTKRPEEKQQAALLRDIVGNPFRPAAVEAGWLAWNGGTIRKLAQAIYDQRAFDGLPVLADALEEAGCTDAEILGHLRGPGPHARGCRVLDAILGKE